MTQPLFNFPQLAKYKTLFYLLLADFAIIALYIILGWRYTLFDIDYEANVPTMYQGLKLLTFGYFFVFVSLKVWSGSIKNTLWLFWAVSAAMFIFLGLDEIGQIHETLPLYFSEFTPSITSQVDAFRAQYYSGSYWVFYFIPFAIVFGIPAAIFQAHTILKHLKSEIWVFILGFALMLSIPLLEAFNTSGLIGWVGYQIFVVIEELFEMLGVSLVAYTFYRVYEKIKDCDKILRKL